jgi:hypothetical protein
MPKEACNVGTRWHEHQNQPRWDRMLIGCGVLFGDLDPDLLSWAFPFWLCESVSVKMLAFGSTWILLRKL